MKIKYIIGIFASTILLSACDLMDSIGNIQPENQLEEKNYVTTPRGAEQALNGIYQDWRVFEITPFRVHMSLLSGGINNAYVYGSEGFYTNAVKPDNEAIQGSYTGLYAVINAANYLIEALEANRAVGIDPTRKTEIIGECKFHRAMAHFMLLRQFGQFYDVNSAYGIVLRREPYRPGMPIVPRDKVADCYAFILQDLTDASTMAPEKVEQHSRISRLTAKALKSRVLLYQKDYPSAATLAKEVLDEAESKGYRMETDDWGQLFFQHYLHPETLFAPYTLGILETCDITLGFSASAYSKDLSTAWAGKAGTFDADPRFITTFQSKEAVRGGLGKYPYNSSPSEKEIGNGYIFMRLAEVYLIHAEAEARQGQSHYPAARASLKVITDRVGYPQDLVAHIPDNELLEAIRQHKWLELDIENGEEWYDLARYTQSGDLAWGSVKSTLKKEWQLILPIPQKALSGNKKLIQNPEY